MPTHRAPRVPLVALCGMSRIRRIVWSSLEQPGRSAATSSASKSAAATKYRHGTGHLFSLPAHRAMGCAVPHRSHCNLIAHERVAKSPPGPVRFYRGGASGSADSPAAHTTSAPKKSVAEA
jgi:hypothetical protein